MQGSARLARADAAAPQERNDFGKIVSLYLAVFDDGEELDGVEVGAYSDFSAFRNAVAENLEGGVAGSQYPTLMLHSDCDGQWEPSEAGILEKELEIIRARFLELPPIQSDVDRLGVRPKSLCDCFLDVDGEPLLDRLINLTKLSQTRNLAILFQ